MTFVRLLIVLQLDSMSIKLVLLQNYHLISNLQTARVKYKFH